MECKRFVLSRFCIRTSKNSLEYIKADFKSIYKSCLLLFERERIITYIYEIMDDGYLYLRCFVDGSNYVN